MENRNLEKINIWENEGGSALILVMIILISGILVFSSIASISLLQRSASSKARSSTEALQLADSCMEWTLMKYYGAVSGAKISDIGGIVGDVFSPDDLPGMLPVNGEDYQVNSCKVYLYKDDGGGGDVVLDSGDTGISTSEITKIRSIGVAGFGDDRTTRAVQIDLDI